jgi:nicotinamide-nucleotide amidase
MIGLQGTVVGVVRAAAPQRSLYRSVGIVCAWSEIPECKYVFDFHIACNGGTHGLGLEWLRFINPESYVNKATETLAIDVGKALQRKGWMLATAESCTGGGVAQAVTDIAGSSGWFERGFVTYSNEAKSAMLGVPAELIAQHGAVSAEVAAAMATGAVAHSAAQVALSTTGIAGPGGAVPGKPVGTVWFGWSVGGVADTERMVFDGDRQAVREQAVLHALQGLLRRLA